MKEDNHAAFNEIYRRYFHLMYVHAFKKLRDEELAKDVIQDLFTNLWHRRNSYSVDDNIAGYLYTSVRNKIFDLFAHQKVESTYIQSLKDYFDKVKSVPTDYLVREKQLQAYIDKEIQALPPKMRRIFEMSRKEHLTHSEIARNLGTSENNVSTQITSALRILRKRLDIVAFIFFIAGSK
ncbi:MAG: RNA polymerase sigma-70 factor [Sphingobacteriales bacterium]